MTMLWIYLPPVILIAALVALVVILGKKGVTLKKKGAFRDSESRDELKKSDGSKIQSIWKIILRIAERTIHVIKIGIKKMEEGLSGILHKMKEKRLGKKIPKPDSVREESKIDYYSEEIILSKAGKGEPESEERRVLPDDSKTLLKEVIIRKKGEPVPQRIVPELAAEDKVKEEALIHRIAENPKDIEAYREVGDYYMSVGNIKDAKDSFKMVLKLRPRDLKAKSSLREIEMKMRLGA